MPFGLKNAAQTFQRFIDEVLRGLPFVYAYLDDLLVASSSAEEHYQHLNQLFQRLDSYGININPSKCELGVSSLEFLGHHVDSQGIRPLPEKVQAVQDFPAPENLTQLRAFLGLANFYRRFVPHCATLMQPLTDLLSSKVKNKSIQLTDAQHQSFKDIKTALAQKAETRYSAFGRELLAVYLSIRHFRHLLDGRSFTVYTDHKPLTYAFASKPDRYSPREIRHLDYISQYSTDLRHIPGRDNVVADALSRNVYGVTISSSPLDFTAIASAQQHDDELIQLRKSSSLKLTDVPLPAAEGTITCDVSTGTARPYIPQQFRRAVFDSLHSLSHPGINATKRLITQRYIWSKYTKMSRIGANHALSVNKLRFTVTPKRQLVVSR
ncbi:gag-pol polyprotein [Apostichopus japonicus]|uniref:Gag-pol polyprotein n=1 Tax=Stichopus japonicus TaxID=307972 RepID=A0A2G8L1S5_STIJA|nr:gag-pol polyprotein [Apostichopus japonicus]